VTRVHVVGAAGYAGAEMIRLVSRHPYLTLGILESESGAGTPVGDSIPELRSLDRSFDPPGTALASVAEGDAVVLAGTGETARALAPQCLARGARVIDLSDAFRLHDRAVTSDGTPAVYGWIERYRSALPGARLVANPGCYPMASLLALAPLAPFASIIEHIVIDAKSGITGAGRSPRTGSLYAETADDVRAYGLHGHRHEAEIGQELVALGIEAPFVFTPHVVPLRRGMLANAYVITHTPIDDAELAAAYERAYGSSAFVRILAAGETPNLRAVAGTNDAEIHVTRKGNVVRAICAIDNLGKGAAGQAVHALNLMYGFSEGSGLDGRSIQLV
jgi:N-acetyl-gamma-glutamyl-phosphate reductase